MTASPPTDGELLRRVSVRDGAAFAVLYERYEAIVAAFLLRRTRDRELAADLTGETFATVVLAASTFRDEGQPAVGWLLGVARNLLARHHERQAVERRARERLGLEPVALSDASLDRVEALIDSDDPANPLLAALAALPAGQRDAVRAYVLEERPYAELAAQLGVPEATVRQRVSRGLARLRLDLGGQQP